MENFLDIICDTLADAFFDSIYLLPFLFLTYVVMEWIEHRCASSTQEKIRSAGKFGPLIGSALGLVPQCGFSAVASTLWAGRVITIGTLVAVFLATSDEMLPLFLARGVAPDQIIGLLATKFAIGMAAGFLIDLVNRKILKRNEGFKIHELCTSAHCECCEDCKKCSEDPISVYSHFDDEMSEAIHTHDHTHDTKHRVLSLLISALKHTFQVLLFIFLITWAINIAIELIGEESLHQVLTNNGIVSVIVSAIFGLIPNCAASVVIADLWCEGALQTPAMLSGLLVSSGVGYLVLFRTNLEKKKTFSVIGIMLAISVACGLMALAIF